MPRTGPNGEYTLPPNTNNQQPNTTIRSSMFNAAMDDVEQTFNTPTPITYGGTGASDAEGARAELGVDFYDGAMGLTAAQQGQARANIGSGVLAGFRNKIINGDFGIAQRGTSFTSSGYTLDRWMSINGAGAVCSILRAPHIVGAYRYQHYASWGRTVAGSGPSLFVQNIEDVYTLAGQRATITFWANADAPTEIVSDMEQMFGTGGSATVDFQSVSHNITNTPQKFTRTIDIPSIYGKILGGGHKLTLRFIWYNNATNAVNNVRIWGVSVVNGDATAEADPFSPRHIQQELALCQRYYERGVYTESFYYASGWGEYYTTVPFATTKRTSPTMLGSVGGAGFTGTYTMDDAGPNRFRIGNTGTTNTGTHGIVANWAADAEL